MAARASPVPAQATPKPEKSPMPSSTIALVGKSAGSPQPIR